MPVLKPTPLVKFDPHNPQHVKAIAEIELTGRRLSDLKFDFEAPFVDGVSYAKHLMHLAWIESMSEIHTELFENLKDRIEGETALRDSSIRKKPVMIGSKLPLERTLKV